MADIAWSPIKTEKGTIQVGESVTADKLGVDKEEYARLKEAGTIRNKKYPDDVGPNESVRERNVRKLAEAVKAASESGDIIDIDESAAAQQAASGAEEVEVPKK